MQRHRLLIGLLLGAGAVAFAVAGPLRPGTRQAPPGGGRDKAAPAQAVQRTSSRAAYATLPLSFESNSGQTDSRVKFLARGSGFNIFLTHEGVTLHLRRPGALASKTDAGDPAEPATATDTAHAVLGLRLAGANPTPPATGLDELPGKSNYVLGHDPRKWRTGVTRYARVSYGDVYPGVDLVFYGNQSQLEYDFLVAPGADASRIQLQLDGADAERVDENGDLIVRVADSEIRQLRPVVYQEWDGRRHFLSGRYVLRGAHQVGFMVSGSRPDQRLVIDPVLAYSSFLGGSGLDVAHAVAVDSSGNVYLTGETLSINFPTQSAEQPANAGGSDAFVTKLDPTGRVVIFSTYLGGSGNENDYRSGVDASGVAVDGAGNVYLTGRTSSIDFPVRNALQGSFRGPDYDAFVAKLSADGSTLMYSTYLGGQANDSGNGLAVDSAGNVYVTGGTKSDDFPITPGAFQGSFQGLVEAYVAKIDPTQQGTASLIYSTYLRGQGLGIDRGTAVAVDSAGNAYVTGRTDSPQFPTTPNAFQVTIGGTTDAFVTVLNPTGTSVVYSTFLGGNGLDVGNGIAVDAAGNAFITGETASTNFQTLNGFQNASAGGSDAFVVQLDPTGTLLVYATYLGGSGRDRSTGIALDAAGKVWVTGETSSGNFPTINAFQAGLGGGQDAFVSRLDLSQQGAASLLFSSFLGGSGNDVGFGIAINATGDAWIVGQTASAADFPIVGAVQGTYGGGASDAFVVWIAAASDYTLAATPSSVMVAPGGTAPYAVTVTPAGGFSGTVDLSVSGLPASATASFVPSSVVITDATPQTSTMSVQTVPSTGLGSFPLTITGVSGTLQRLASVTLVVVNDSTRADLSISKNASSNPVELGTNLNYIIRTLNRGPANATHVQVTDGLAPALRLVSSTPTQGTCNGTTTVTCDLGTLAAGATATVTIVVTPQAIGPVNNTATVAADQATNNSASVNTTVEASCPGQAPCMLDPNLGVNTVVSGLAEPTGVVFLGPDDFLVTEKSTGKVKRITGGVLQGVVLDLAVNSASERGLLGIALHPNFASNGFVYLYWTCRGQPAAADCDSVADDTSDLSLVPLLGNRIDRFIWDGARLTFDLNLIRLRSYQRDADANGTFNQPLRGNHNGGKVVFGPDDKLYALVGDNGRRGWMQNIFMGVLPNGRDDQFGGPEPDNAHFTGVIIRLNDDGTAPGDNPFFDCGGQVGGEVGANIQKVFAYGVRNSFGLAFDPVTGSLWNEENGDDSFDEINRIPAGSNNGWVQTMGPLARISDFKAIETSPQYFGLQQGRWPPTSIADTPDDAAARLDMMMLPGAVYNDPLFSWKYAVAPSPIGFVIGDGLGPSYNGAMFVGAARTFLAGGYLFVFRLTMDRSDIDFSADSRLADRVADNADKFDLNESESLLIGRDFGITTDIQTSPRGTLYVVSLSKGAVYEVAAR
jgi:uncharacterized repeat protein (TIGR01451 family)